MCESIKGSGETAHLHRIVSAFAARICDTRDDPKVLIVSRDIFERHTMHHSNEQALTFIMMLVFSRCIVSFNNYSTLYMVHSIPLACFHVIELQ